MSDPKNKNYLVKPDLKIDSRLRDIFIRMEVLTEDEIKDHKNSLEDSADNVESFAIVDIV